MVGRDAENSQADPTSCVSPFFPCAVSLSCVWRTPRFDLLGFSYGGAIAYHIAATEPERVRRVVVVDDGIMMNRKDLVDMQEELGIDDGNGFWRLPSTPKDVRQLEEIAFASPLWVPNFVAWDVLKVRPRTRLHACAALPPFGGSPYRLLTARIGSELPSLAL